MTDVDVKLTPREAERILRETEYWHYPFDLPWGHVGASKPGTEDRHRQRRSYFFEPLLREFGGTLEGKRVLDLGCCQGFWTIEAARAGAAACLGLDSSEAFVQEARALRALTGADACEFRQAHLEDDPWWDGLRPFDVTLFLGLFYHLADPISVFRRAAALTREAMVIDTVVQQREEPLLLLVPRNPDEPSTKNSGLSTGIRVQPTPAALVALLRDAGFASTEVLPVRGPMPADYASGRRVAVLGRRGGAEVAG